MKIPLFLHSNPKVVKESPTVILLPGIYKFEVSEIRDTKFKVELNFIPSRLHPTKLDEVDGTQVVVVDSDKCHIKAVITSPGTEKEITMYIRKIA